MATVGTVRDVAFRGRFEDQMTAGAATAARAIKELGTTVVETDEAVSRSTRTAQSWVRSADPLTAAANRVATAQRNLANAQKALSVEQAAGGEKAAAAERALEGLSARVRRAQADMKLLETGHASAAVAITGVGNSARLTAREMTQLAPQINDVVTQLALGQSVFQTVASQGGQIYQIFGSAGRMLGAFAASLGPVGIAVAAVAVPLGIVLAAFNTQEGRLADLRSSLRGVSTDYAALAVQVDEAAKRIARSGIGVSRSDATEVMGRLRQSAPAGSNFDLEAMTRDAADFARVLGTTVPEAADRFGRAMRDPGALVKELAERNFPGMTGELRRTVEVMANGGEKGAAFELVLSRVRATTAGAARDISPMEQATRGLATAWGEFTNMVTPWLATGGKLFLEFLTGAAQAAGALGGAILRIPAGVAALAGAATNSGTSTFGDADLDNFERTLVRRESGGRADVVNQFGYSGLYQFGTAALQSSGSYASAPGENLRRNEWAGTFQIPSFPQVRTQADFLANPAAQREAFRQHTNRLNDSLDAVPGSENFNRTGLLGVAHGYGPGAAAEFIRNGGRSDRADGNGVRLDATYQAFITAATGAVQTAQGAIATTAGAVATATRTSPIQERAFRIANGEEGRSDPLATDATNRARITGNMDVLNQALAMPGNTQAATEAYTRALEAQRVAYEGTLTAAERMTRAEQDRTQVLGVLDPAQREVAQALQQYSDAQRAAGRAENPADRAQIQAAVLARLRAEYGNLTNAVDRQVQSSTRLATAYAQGSAAGQQMEFRERALEEVRRSGIQGAAAQAQAVTDLTARYRDLAQTQSDMASSKSAEASQREIEMLQRQNELVGVTANERERELAALRERQRILTANAGADLNSDESRRAIQLAADTATARLENQRLAAGFNEVARIGEQAFDRIGSALTEAFATGRIASVRFGDVARAVFSEVLQGMVKLAVLNPLKNAFGGGNNPTIFSGGSMLSGLGSLTGITGGGGAGGAAEGISSDGSLMSQVGNMSSGQSLMSGLRGINPGDYISGATPFNTGWGAADGVLNTPTGLGGGATGTGLTYGGAAMGAAGVAGGLYGIYSGVQKGGVGGGFGVAGGAATAGLSAAAMAGMAVPVYGWIAAAVLTIIGALLPGQKASGKGQEFRSTLDGVTEKNGLGGDRYSPENAAQAQSAVQGIVDLAKQVGDKLGGVRFGGEIAVGVTSGRKEGDPGNLYLEVAGQKGQYTNDEAGSKSLAEQAGQFILAAFKTVTTGEYAGILNASGGSIEKLQSDLTWYEDVYKKFGEATKAANAFQQGLDQVTASFAASVARAQELSLSTDAVTEAREREIRKVYEQRDMQVGDFDYSLRWRSLSLNGGPDAARTVALEQFDRSATQQIKQAQAALEGLGLSSEQVAERIGANEEVLSRERLAIQQQYADQSVAIAQQAAAQQEQARQTGAGSALGVVTSMREYMASLSTSDASAGTVLDRFGAAGNDFNAIYGAARAGDANSISGLQGAAETYRGLAREVFGGGQGYADAITLIGERIGSITDIGAEALTQSFIAENARENTDRLVDELVQLRAEIRQILLRPTG